ncbi:LysR family transcriptional regulator [Actibacterium sp. XHP0104]|uniref:LysR family transcriptional regulator n=1 Tax=Actibacterium sp. XHP0104 TaxID=2984335 RepID=UPI0021E94146|nr:LysR family transcriptional regulator [Actibacterium sp. XHP0104]MCV2880425.1 LysR family transcriptional regulator [Actibacterium sp. XHP0104]
MIKRPLDLSTVRAFVLIAELRNFTRAAEALGTTQASISLMLQRLEKSLGCQLVVRTPRRVELSADGRVFLDHARNMLAAHDGAFSALGTSKERLTIGISDHVAGPELSQMIARMNAQNSNLIMEVRIGSSADLLQAYDQRGLDVALTRFQADRDDGKVIARESFHWFAAPGWEYRSDEPLPVATMPEPCGVRLLAGQLLDEAGIAWNEVFVGGGVLAVAAAVQAGLGVAALSRRMAPLGMLDVGPRLGLPQLPKLPIVLYSRTASERAEMAVSTLASVFCSAVKS